MIPNLASLIPLIKKIVNPVDNNMDNGQDAQFQPNHVAFDQMANTIAQSPNRNPNPSFARKLGGDIIGMSAGLHPLGISGGQPIGASFDPMKASAASDEFVQRPYYQGMDDVSSKIKNLQPMVNAENAENSNKLSLFNSNENRKVTARTQQRLEERDKEIADQNDVKNAQNEEANKRKQQYTDALTFKMQHPTMQKQIDKDGMLVYVDPLHPTVVIRTGVDTGKLNDMEKMQIGLNDKLEEIAASGKEARATKETTPGKNLSVPAGKDLSPTQKTADIQNKSKQAYEEHPEWKGYLRINPDTKKYEISFPTNGDLGILSKIGNFVYGTDRILVKRKSDGQPGFLSRDIYEKKKDTYEEVTK